METKSTNSTQNSAWPLEKDKATLEMLGHILSPLELEAYKHSFQAFEYGFKDMPIIIEGIFARELMLSCLSKISMFSEILICHEFRLKGDNPRYKQFLSSKVASLDLPTYLKNKLRGQGCDDLLDVMSLGRKKISRAKGIGKSGVKLLERLFEDNGCAMLFT
jgi:hypothetical protein